MGHESDKKSKKRVREAREVEYETVAKKLRLSDSPIDVTTSLAAPNVNVARFDASSIQKHAAEKRSKAKSGCGLLELPAELLCLILGLLDDFSSPITTIPVQDLHASANVRKFNRMNLFQTRCTCRTLRAMTSQPFVWATHLLLRTSSSSFSALHSLSPFIHDEHTIRHVTTFLLVVDDSLASLRESKDFLLALLSNSHITHLILTRRTRAAETFTKTRVLMDLTPTEKLLKHLMEKPTLLCNLRHLSLSNVLVRPPLLAELQNQCKGFVILDTSWSEISLPTSQTRSRVPLNQSGLLSVNQSKHVPLASETTALSSVEKTHRPHAVLDSLKGEAAVLLTETPIASSTAFSRLHLNGIQATMLSNGWITPSLMELRLDISDLASVPSLPAWSSAFDALLHCPLLQMLCIRLGPEKQHVNVDWSRMLQKMEFPQLKTLILDEALPMNLEELAPLCSRLPLLQTVELHLSPTSFVLSNSFTTNFPLFTPHPNPRPDAAASQMQTAMPAPVISSSTPVSSIVPLKQMNLVTNNSLSLLLGRPQISQSLASMFGKPSSNAPSSNPASGRTSPSSATTTVSSPTSHPCGLFHTLSQHCLYLTSLQIELTAPRVGDEDLASFSFPYLVFLKTNVAPLSKKSFSNLEVRMPRLRHLHLANCLSADGKAVDVSALASSPHLLSLCFEKSPIDLNTISPFLDSSMETRCLVHLDLRVMQPYGVTAQTLQRIATRCPRLTHLLLSVSDSSIQSSVYAILIKTCNALKVLHIAERSSISAATSELLQRSGVSVRFG